MILLLKIVVGRTQKLMWIKEIFLWVVGFTGGAAVAAGVFAFAVTVGVIPRFVAKTHTSKYVLCYETSILFGGILGVLLTIFQIKLPVGQIFLWIFGLAAGINTGCLAVALAEILDAFPILFRRIKLKTGENWVLYVMAVGKTLGSFYFWLQHMAK